MRAEYSPYARTGGLAEAVSGLAPFQHACRFPRRRDHAALPDGTRRAPDLEPVGPPFRVPLGRASRRGSALPSGGGATRGAAGLLPRSYRVTSTARASTARPGATTSTTRAASPSSSLAALPALPRVAPGPLVLHAHDWHTALAPVYLRTVLASEPWVRDAITVLSVHNPGYQGQFPPEAHARDRASLGAVQLATARVVRQGELSQGRPGVRRLRHHGEPTQAAELRTPGGGFGLHDMFIGLGDRLVGVLNGIDQRALGPRLRPADHRPVFGRQPGGQAPLQGRRSSVSFGLPQRRQGSALRDDRAAWSPRRGWT